MKKLLLAVVVLSGLALTSCSKKKDCSCETDVMGVKSTALITDYEGDCSDMDSSSSMMGIETSVTCTKD